MHNYLGGLLGPEDEVVDAVALVPIKRRGTVRFVALLWSTVHAEDSLAHAHAGLLEQALAGHLDGRPLGGGEGRAVLRVGGVAV